MALGIDGLNPSATPATGPGVSPMVVPVTKANLQTLGNTSLVVDKRSNVDPDTASTLSASVSNYTQSCIVPSMQSFRARQPFSSRGSARSSRLATPASLGLSARAPAPRPARCAEGAELSRLAGGAASSIVTGGGDSLEWAVLDKVAAQLYKQDSARQKAEQALIRERLREDLSLQVRDAHIKQEREKKHELRYRLLQDEAQQRYAENENLTRMIKEEKNRAIKGERDRQLQLKVSLMHAERMKEKEEATQLVQKVQKELDLERARVERRWMQQRELQKQAVALSNEGATKRDAKLKELSDEEDRKIEEYECAKERRLAKVAGDKQRNAVERLKLEQMRKEKADRERAARELAEEARTLSERRAKDAYAANIEVANKQRLEEQRLATQAFLLEQMNEKQRRRQQDQRQRDNIRCQQESDAKEHISVEEQKVLDRRLRNLQHRTELERQIALKASKAAGKSSEVMTEAELRLNKCLLERLNKALLTVSEPNESRAGSAYAQSVLGRS